MIYLGDKLLHKYNDTVKHALEREIDLYNDFIIADFEDTYRNLTLKTLHMLDWVSTYCSSATYFVKTDDDVFLNVPEFLSLIHEIRVSQGLPLWIYDYLSYNILPWIVLPFVTIFTFSLMYDRIRMQLCLRSMDIYFLATSHLVT
jgi:hypothetical protein